MKIYISADIEGVSGVTHTKQTLEEGPEYQKAIKLLMGEINSAIEGAVQGGAKEITVNDGHYSMRNISLGELNPPAKLISGFPKLLHMMEGIDGSYDGSIFIGYHAMAGSAGVLAHTMSTPVFSFIKINGREFGETALNAALAGHFNVSVIMVSGDDILKSEAVEILTGVEYCQVKKARGNRAAECLGRSEARELIQKSAKKAVENIAKYKPFKVDYPVKLEIGFKNPVMADITQAIPGVKRVSPYEVNYTAENIIEVMKLLFVIVSATGILFTDAYK